MTDRPTTSSHAAEHSRQSKRPDFSSLHGRSVAVILRQRGRQLVYRGTAEFQRNDALGNLLIITATDPQPGDPNLTIVEEMWQGNIIPDLEHGSELWMIP